MQHRRLKLTPDWTRIAAKGALPIGALLLFALPGSAADAPDHMPETTRGAISKIVVVGGDSAIDRAISGTYDEDTPGFLGGVSGGSAAATPSAQVGPVTVAFPFPILQLPGAILGGITGATQREIQELRDAMTDDIAKANSSTLINDGLALDVYRDIQRLPDLESKLFAATTELPTGIDAVIYVKVKDITIEVEKSDAILTATAAVSVESPTLSSKVYETEISYQDRASLSDWTRDDNALWRDFANYARHYLGREVSADAFTRVKLNHSLQPAASPDIKVRRKDHWNGSTKAALPTLAWEFELLGDDSYGGWLDDLDTSAVAFDLEIYSAKRMVYEMKQLPGTEHTLVYELDPCETYRWSVRPVYTVGDDVRVGEWMRYSTESQLVGAKGIVGTDAAKAPAYTQDFASLAFKCR